MLDTLDLLFSDACTQSDALASGKCSSIELLETVIAEIEIQNKKLNCFIYIDEITARQAARESDERRTNGMTLSPADGLIIAVKDNIDVKGMPTTAGLGMALYVPKTDAPVIKSLRNAGVIVIGKTNMDEAAVGTSNNNPHHGQCFNPSFPNYVPGGSSGGSASAVAAGLCSMALGTDTMGSVRIPAACCGLVGLKPSYEEISNVGVVPCSPKLDTVGPICRSVRDQNFWLSLNKSKKYSASQNGKLSDAKLIIIDNLQEYFNLPNESVEAYKSLSFKLKQHTHFLKEKKFHNIDFGKIRLSGLISVEACLSKEFETQIENDSKTNAGKENDIISPSLKKLIHWFNKQDASVLKQTDLHIKEVKHWFNELLGDADAIILPTLTESAPKITQRAPSGLADLTAPANIAGLPALSFPLTKSKEAKPPISFQIIGKHGEEAKIIRLASQITKL